MASKTDTQLIEAMKRREPSAWGAAIRSHARDVYSFVFHLVGGDVGTTEDLSQETWVEAVDHFDRYDISRGHLRDWLFGIARKRVAMHFRRKKRGHLASIDEADGESLEIGDGRILPDQVLEQLERAAIVRATLLTLNEDRREVLKLKYVDGLTVEEISERFGRSVKAVESLLSRARDQLRKLLRSCLSASTQGERHVPSVRK